jgi:hypothetical protein
MEKYIKFKRFEYNGILLNKIQEIFDELIMNGWEIIHYNEDRIPVHESEVQTFLVVIVAGKKQENTLI